MSGHSAVVSQKGRAKATKRHALLKRTRSATAAVTHTTNGTNGTNGTNVANAPVATRAGGIGEVELPTAIEARILGISRNHLGLVKNGKRISARTVERYNDFRARFRLLVAETPQD